MTPVDCEGRFSILAIDGNVVVDGEWPHPELPVELNKHKCEIPDGAAVKLVAEDGTTMVLESRFGLVTYFLYKDSNYLGKPERVNSGAEFVVSGLLIQATS